MTKSSLAVAETLSEQQQPSGPPEDGVSESSSTSLGTCLGGDHPTLRGRSRIRWRDARGREHEAWLAKLQGLTPKRGDRVLLTIPDNHDEPVVLGVLDGLGRPEGVAAAEEGPLVKLGANEALRVASSDGTPLLEVRAGSDGPDVRLLAPPEALRMPGTFRVSADDIELEAREGEVRIAAAGDVKVVGEIVRLN